MRIYKILIEEDRFSQSRVARIHHKHTMSINDKPKFVMGTKKTVYELDENLEDDDLRIIMNPQLNPDALNNLSSKQETEKQNRKN